LNIKQKFLFELLIVKLNDIHKQCNVLITHDEWLERWSYKMPFKLWRAAALEILFRDSSVVVLEFEVQF
jgi:hypothetical protein